MLPLLIRIVSDANPSSTLIKYGKANHGGGRPPRAREAWTRGSRQLPRIARVAIVSSRRRHREAKSLVKSGDSGGRCRWQLARQLGKVFWPRLPGSRRDLSLSLSHPPWPIMQRGRQRTVVVTHVIRGIFYLLMSSPAAPVGRAGQLPCHAMLTGCYCLARAPSKYGRLLWVLQ